MLEDFSGRNDVEAIRPAGQFVQVAVVEMRVVVGQLAVNNVHAGDTGIAQEPVRKLTPADVEQPVAECAEFRHLPEAIRLGYLDGLAAHGRTNLLGIDTTIPGSGSAATGADEVAELADLSRPDRGIETAPLEPMPATRAPPPPPRDLSPQFAFSDSGQYLVQVAAFRSQDAAEAAWRKSSAEHPDLYRGAGKRIQRADLGAKGVFYRLRVGGFSQKTEADAFCDALKAQGDNCIVVTG